MNFTFKIEPRLLSALLDFTLADYEFRPSMGGIHFEVSSEKILVIATNGVLMGIAKLDNNQEIAKPFSFTAPRELFLKIISIKNPNDVEIKVEEQIITASQNDKVTISYSANIIAYSFLDWRRALPLNFDNKPAQYDPALMVVINRIANKIKKNCPTYITPNDNKAGYIDFGRDDFFGVIMPMKPQITKTLPSWVLQKTSANNK